MASIFLSFPPEKNPIKRLSGAVLMTDVVKRADVRMVQSRHRPSLTLEPLANFGIRRKMIVQDLDRDSSIEPSVSRAIDLPHPARAERGRNFIRTSLAPEESAIGFARHYVSTSRKPQERGRLTLTYRPAYCARKLLTGKIGFITLKMDAAEQARRWANAKRS